MRSFLREMQEKFVELENHCETCDKPADQCTCDDDIEEQNVTGAIAGYSTPAAFRKTVKRVGYASGVEESVNKPASFKWKETGHQKPESNEETAQDKFPFSTDIEKWPMNDQEYPTRFSDQPYGTANIKDRTEKITSSEYRKNQKIGIEEILEKKYEQLIESYRNFSTADSKTTPEQKVKNTIKEVARKLQEIETMVNYNSRLKTESGVTSSAYGNSTKKALAKISERLIKISERVRALGE